METLFQDVRYGFRMLAKSPAFTAVAVLTLALGIGANTAIFTFVNALLLKTLPVKAPQELVVVGDPTRVNDRQNGTPETNFFSYPLYRELRDNNSVFTGLIAAGTQHHLEVDADGAGGAADEVIAGRMVSGNYFSVLAVEAAAGRLITTDDDTAENANSVVVLTYGYWQRKFALSPAIIGKEIRLNGYPFTVVGVTQPNFRSDVVGDRIDVFVPITMQQEIIRGTKLLQDPNASWLSLIGRLKPGISAAQAKANLTLVLQQALKGSYGASISAQDRKDIADEGIKVVAGSAGPSEFRGNYETPLLLLTGIVGLVLLIACVNVANLLLARATARSKEIAVRLAIGASRGRLLRQLMTESVLLALCGGVCGALLAVWFRCRCLARIARCARAGVHEHCLHPNRHPVWHRALIAQPESAGCAHAQRQLGGSSRAALSPWLGKGIGCGTGRAVAARALRREPAGAKPAKTADARSGL